MRVLDRVREALALGAQLPMVVAALLVGCWAEGEVYDHTDGEVPR